MPPNLPHALFSLFGYSKDKVRRREAGHTNRDQRQDGCATHTLVDSGSPRVVLRELD